MTYDTEFINQIKKANYIDYQINVLATKPYDQNSSSGPNWKKEKTN